MRVDWMKYGGLVLLSILVLTGCNMFKGEQTLEQMDAPPEEAELTDNIDDIEETEEGSTQPDEEGGQEASEEEADQTEETGEAETDGTLTHVLYLIDQNGLVVPQELELPAPASKEVAKQVLEYLVQDGPVTSMLPSGFQAVLPAGTEIIDLNLDENGTMVVNVSEEFADYQAEDESKIIESITHTLTEFSNVERVKLWINGEEQQNMPVNGTPISQGYSRENGINVHQANGVDFMESEAATLYFPMQGDEMVYFVPVTQHIRYDKEQPEQSIVQALMEGPAFDLPLQHYINHGSQLTDEPTLADGVLSLTFNEDILSNSADGTIADEVLQSIVLTLTELEDIQAVDVSVENHEEVINEEGQPYTDPVTREMVTPVESI
ncbi:GerMN domain-containing protein [Gracilibacillus alcaliphilus]|uniref:GerMN domain-containing protein n=1 Tax=Gracilibacillus alcaliphilus TaxID=1401441 RepID=UPI00195A32CF|nr:GerMN domain-containing protein [Gracilibacillus alcaliphilus]MBM7679668.1 germination protein M [Gracilibacillus alcaliphilus]